MLSIKVTNGGVKIGGVSVIDPYSVNVNNPDGQTVDATIDVENTYSTKTKYFIEPGKKVSDDGSDYKSVVGDSSAPNISLTSSSDFDTTLSIPKEFYNGLRSPTATVYYTKQSSGDGSANGVVLRSDYALPSLNPSSKNLDNIGSNYSSTDKSSWSNDKVNILTPVALNNPVVQSTNVVNHTNIENGSEILQKNADFTLTPKTKAPDSSTGYNLSDTNEFVSNFYVTLDFDIVNAKVGNTNLGSVSAGQIITIPKGQVLSAKTTQNIGSTATGQISNKIHVVAATYNKPSGEGPTDTSYIDSISTKKYTGGSSRQAGYYGRTDAINDAYHMASLDYTTTNLGRIYDFKVTDCSDVNWKNVFRSLSSNNTVNATTGKVYYAGINRLNINSVANFGNTNEMDLRQDIGGTGSLPLRTLPVGPYKHDPNTYVNAPKLGYRIAFDLKTTGFLSSDTNISREIEITPSYYYISKDGKTYDPNIELYYKKTTDKYIKLAGSGYTIYFKPNDGYRNTYNVDVTPDSSTMSTKLEPINIASTTGYFVLNNSMMNTSNDKFIQSWYGEYKLPNSTVAIEKGASIYDSNSIKKDGYIGVKFNIECVDKQGTSIIRNTSYNKDDKNANPSINTTQWDYEGFLGFRFPGQELNQNLSLQLEKGTWSIDKNRYKEIKGTVILYDLDQRAASDYE